MRSVLPGAVLLLVCTVSVARAQAPLAAKAEARGAAPLDVIVFRAASRDASLKSLANALDRLLLAEVGKHREAVAQHALDLPSTQLALDCMAETPACLQSVMAATDAQALIAPALEHSGS